MEAWQGGRYGEIRREVFIGLAFLADRQAVRNRGALPAWEFARYLRVYPSFALLAGAEVFEINRREIEAMFSDEEQENFVSYFETVMFAPGEGILNQALRLANERPLRTSHRRLYDRFVSLAGWLQKDCGKKHDLPTAEARR